MIVLFPVFVVLGLAGGCGLLYEDDVLSLQKQTYTGNQLKLNGYYYLGDASNVYSSYFFYRNGVLTHGGGSAPGTVPFDFLESSFVSPRYVATKAKEKAAWGLFVIAGSTIKFERWYCAEGTCKAYVREGQILNDTTFHITESYRMRNGVKTEVRSKDETFSFRPFRPKPDSTNGFIP